MLSIVCCGQSNIQNKSQGVKSLSLPRSRMLEMMRTFHEDSIGQVREACEYGMQFICMSRR